MSQSNPDAVGLVVWSDEAMLDHHPDHQVRTRHPERPARLQRASAALDGLAEVERRTPPRATSEQLATVHASRHVERIMAMRGQDAQIDPDTGVSPGSIDAALLAAGAAMEAASVAMGDPRAPRHFCLVRPPGHHAEPDRAMGFCLFSNLALGVERALAKGAKRVLVVDWDVHHGNGTQAAFYERPEVLVFDVHQRGHYPGSGAVHETGRGEGTGATINVPVLAGFDDDGMLAVFDHLLEPIARDFDPDIIFIAAGFDAHVDDPLGDLVITSKGFGLIAARVRRLADELCGGRLVATLEGGYDLSALESSVRACAASWTSVPDPASIASAARTVPTPAVRSLLEEVARHHGSRLARRTR